jgi:hypothetical protein
MENNDIPLLYVDMDNINDNDDIVKIKNKNELLKKQQIKYRNIINNLRMDNLTLQDEINKLIDENVKLVDNIKEKHN